MTRINGCDCRRCALSNYFDRVLAGVGLDGSSFADADAITHDKRTHRFLVQEFKQAGEAVSTAQHWMLADVAAIPNHFTVWIVRRVGDGWIEWAELPPDKSAPAFHTISEQQYRERFRRWWADKPRQ